MSRTLLIHVDREHLDREARAAWLALGRDGRPLAAAQAGWPVPQPGDSVVLLAPAADVLLLAPPTLAGSRAQRLRALPFAVEDQLAAPVETQQVALADDDSAVAVIARQRLDALLAAARGHGLEPDHVVPETWLLPVGDAPRGVLADGRALLRMGPARAMALPAAELDGYAALLGPGFDAAKLERAEGQAGLLDRLVAMGGGHRGLDLLAGDYAVTARHAGARRRLRLAALLAAAAVGLAFVLAGVEYWMLERRAEAQRAEMEALLRQAVPGIGRIVDPSAQMRARVAELGGGAGDDALSLVAAVAPAVAGSGRFAVDVLDYRAGRLDVTLRAPDVAALDGLRERLAGLPGIEVELLAATPGEGGVEGRLRLEAGGRP